MFWEMGGFGSLENHPNPLYSKPKSLGGNSAEVMVSS